MLIPKQYTQRRVLKQKTYMEPCTYDGTCHSGEHDHKEGGGVFPGVDEVRGGLIGVVVPPHALGKPPPRW